MTDTFSFGPTEEVSHAGSRKGRYPPEYKARMIELVRAGRSPRSLARDLTTEARKELVELKREKWLRMERDIRKKEARPGSRGRADRSPAGV